MGICDSLCINSIAIRAISCCFVIAMRADLREEFDMADEAFALSPISARATLPSEEDYAAIAEAFMETSRGRWFLTEYAKRNRNADTRMVLDAVARIEQNLAAQREETLEREASLQRGGRPFGAAGRGGRRRGGSGAGAPDRGARRHPQFGRGGRGIGGGSARQPRAGTTAGAGPQGCAGAAGNRLAVAGNRQ